MGWFFPTFGRPDRFERLVAEAPGGVPPGMVVYLTEGDPQLWQNVQVCQSRGLQFTIMPPDSRLADIYRAIFSDFPYEPCYGIVTDDIWPVTPKWWEMLERAAGDRCIAHAHDPRETSPVPSAACLGGNLVRVIGGITPPDCDCRHNYIDNIWQILGKMFALLRPVAEALVEHHHPIRGLAKMDRMDLGLAVLAAVSKPGASYTTNEIAAWAGCTHQAITRLELKALRKLRYRLNPYMRLEDIVDPVNPIPHPVPDF